MNPKHAEAFARLTEMYRRVAEGCPTKKDTETDLIFVGPEPGPDGEEVWLGGVQWKKRYVSVHLMPVYVHPPLLDGISDALRKRMQGKSCFNFTKVDEPLFEELEALARAGLAHFRETGRLPAA
ncbi:MAG TPA: hypothetical protein RMH99_31115 [Sandaracinaceae bacterium LLY-WYZ-13_1]|nr:hypothetical protein [Sandaracinaceae bacterium LLY-WYZ-13_1]